ncbi:MAG: C40 family peptidase [Crocinitomicaceae bacterium]|nr:C40 family peptidase [Crocinitomicaceae bacterium]
MKRLLVLFISLNLLNSFGQDKKIDKLEMFYAQGYYAKVLRQSEKLLADPLYDYSGLPSFYKSLSLFRLSSDPYWLKRHTTAIDDAIAAYQDFLDNEKANAYVFAHYFEIAALKTYLEKLETSFRDRGLNGSADKLLYFMNNELNGIKSKPDPQPVKENNNSNTEAVSTGSDLRNQIVAYAKQFIGVKYVWAGTDENGFDCSGYTSFVMKKYGIVLSRTASGQLSESKQIKVENAEKADLVFFGSDGKISHVGLVTSDKGAELEMIHASTSKGVIITNVVQSTYWNPKLQATGTYL